MDWQDWLEKDTQLSIYGWNEEKPKKKKLRMDDDKQRKLAEEIAAGDREDQKDLFVKNPKVRKSWETWLDKNNAIETSHKKDEKSMNGMVSFQVLILRMM